MNDFPLLYSMFGLAGTGGMGGPSCLPPSYHGSLFPPSCITFHILVPCRPSLAIGCNLPYHPTMEIIHYVLYVLPFCHVIALQPLYFILLQHFFLPSSLFLFYCSLPFTVVGNLPPLVLGSLPQLLYDTFPFLILFQPSSLYANFPPLTPPPSPPIIFTLLSPPTMAAFPATQSDVCDVLCSVHWISAGSLGTNSLHGFHGNKQQTPNCLILQSLGKSRGSS